MVQRAVSGERASRAGTQRPNSAMVLIRCKEGGPTYAEVMGEARSGISLDELSITNSKVRRAQTGGLLLEIGREFWI